MKKKKPTKAEQEAINAIIGKVDESVKFILENIEHLDKYKRDDLIEAINPIGVHVKATNLNEYYQISEFCEANNITFENYSFY